MGRRQGLPGAEGRRPRWIRTHLQGRSNVHAELCLKGADLKGWLEELELLQAPGEGRQPTEETGPNPQPFRPPALLCDRHPLQQQLQAIHSRAVGGGEVISELAQQSQPELREGGKAVSQALLLQGMGSSGSRSKVALLTDAEKPRCFA